MLNKKTITIFIKVVILALSLGYIAKKLYTHYLNGLLTPNNFKFESNQYYLLALCISLVFFNWGLEAVKWKILLKDITKISIPNALKSVLCGLSISIFTPNRVGEFGGRILTIEQKNRTKAAIATLVGNAAQLLTTLLIGTLLFYFYQTQFSADLPIHIKPNIIKTTLLVLNLLGLSLYFGAPAWIKLTTKISGLKKLSKHLIFISNYKTTTLLKLLLFSIARYTVFTTQYVLLLLVFNINISYFNAAILITQVYLVMTFIPTFAFSEVGVRGSVAVLIFSVATTSTLSIILASLILWIVNLAIPAIFGSYFIAKLKN